jgi:hypothetical protein
MSVWDISARLNAAAAVRHDPVRLSIEAHKATASRRWWAAMMLARGIHTCESVIAGRPVMASCLDGEVLRRALRGERLPSANTFVRVRAGHLDAIAEAGPLSPKNTKGGK